MVEVLGGVVVDGGEIEEGQLEGLTLLGLLLPDLVHLFNALLLAQHQIGEVALAEGTAGLEFGGVEGELACLDEVEDVVIAGTGDELEEDARGAF